MKTKKIVALALTALMAVGSVFALASCGGGKTSSSGTKLPPRDLREGYTEEFDGFTSTVHWVQNTTTDKKIYGRIFRPADFSESKQYPALIMSHGYNGSSEGATNALIQNCVSKGMIVYTYDFCGGARMSKSEGKTTEMTILTEVSDLESVLADVKALSYSDDDKIALFGQSFGGLCTALTAPKHKDDVAAVILQAPAIKYEVRTMYESKDLIPETVENQFMTVSKDFYLAFWDLDIPAEIAKWDKDIFVMVGTEDDLRPGVIEVSQVYGDHLVRYAEDTEDLYVVDGVHIVKDAPHSFHTEDFAKVMDEINAYLKAENIIS